MKIEFRKIPTKLSNFEVNSDSVKFSGIFSKITPQLAKIQGKIEGELQVDCCRCSKEIDLILNESSELYVSDGIYSYKEDDEDLMVIEVENHEIDFDALLSSEIESIKSDFYLCETCNKEDGYLDIEY